MARQRERDPLFYLFAPILHVSCLPELPLLPQALHEQNLVHKCVGREAALPHHPRQLLDPPQVPFRCEELHKAVEGLYVGEDTSQHHLLEHLHDVVGSPALGERPQQRRAKQPPVRGGQRAADGVRVSEDPHGRIRPLGQPVEVDHQADGSERKRDAVGPHLGEEAVDQFDVPAPREDCYHPRRGQPVVGKAILLVTHPAEEPPGRIGLLEAPQELADQPRSPHQLRLLQGGDLSRIPIPYRTGQSIWI
ncbi:hypothetical protein Taro_013790 [Colocasia esculenta]|uniref:Uncharacterized protein n=1 Tax=Colocasia esculenta TaxID=4460 RepID=A0A843UH48_COLES|nr:hypothetical protein [Colocasia esculenta]